jgi:hypothetical protein
MSTFLSTQNILHFIKELIWWLITACVAVAILYPITSQIDYIFFNINFIFIFITLTYFRWTLFIRTLPFLQPVAIRFILFVINAVLILVFAQQEQKFLGFIDNFYVEDFGFIKQGVIMYDDVKERFFKYLYNEIVFFNTGAIVMCLLFNLRLIVAWWQLYNYKMGNMLED